MLKVNDITKYKEIIKKVKCIQLRVVLEGKLTFQVCILSEIISFKRKHASHCQETNIICKEESIKYSTCSCEC